MPLHALQARYMQRLRGIDIPRPFSLDVFAAAVAAHRNRALRILPLPGLVGADGLSGAWVATDTADYVFVDADASPWHRDLIGLHEISHVLCGHGAAGSRFRELAGDLVPSLGDVTVQRVLGRHGGSSRDEEEAEQMACLILAGLPVPPLSDARQAAADLASLRALRGLRLELAAAWPGAVARPWKRGIAGPVRDPRIRLIRRIAEIRDAALILRSYVPVGTVMRGRRLLAASGLTGKTLDAAAEACWLQLAARAALAGRPASRSVHVFPGASTLHEEAGWLRQGAEGVINPEELTRLVRIPPGDDLGWPVCPDDKAVPPVDGRHRQSGGDHRLAHRVLPDQQAEAVAFDGARRPPVGICHHERRQVVLKVAEQRPRLGIRAFIEDLRQVAQAVHPGHEHAEPSAAGDRLVQPSAAEDERVRDACTAKQRADGLFGRARHASIGHEHVRSARSPGGQRPGLRNLALHRRWDECLIAARNELALQDERAARQVDSVDRVRPRAVERAVTPSVPAVGERLHRLTPDLTQNGGAEILEATPAKRVQLEFRHARRVDHCGQTPAGFPSSPPDADMSATYPHISGQANALQTYSQHGRPPLAGAGG